MTIQDHHKALVQSHRDVDPMLTAVLERGERLHRRRRHMASAAVAVVLVAAMDIGIASAQSAPQTRVTTAAGTPGPAASTRSTTVAPSTAVTTIRLQAPDWEASDRDGTPSSAEGVRVDVVSADGQPLDRKTIDVTGEAFLLVRATSVTILVDQCNFKKSVILKPGVTNTISFPCSEKNVVTTEGGARVLPSRKALSVDGNPTDDEIRAAFDDAAACIRDAGLSVPVATVDIGSDGVARGTMQVGLGDSGLDLDAAAAIRDGCRDYYEAVLVARGRARDEKEGRGR